MRISKLDASGNVIPIANESENISITNGTSVADQYVSGATETDGVIALTRASLPAGTVSGATDTAFTGLANDDVIQRKSGTFVNRTTDQLLVDILTGTGNGVLTNTNGILGTTTLPSPPQSGVNPNPTDGRIPLGQGLNADFVDSTIEQTTDTLLTFDATIHHDQGGRDFNIYPTGILADFVTNPTNYDFSVITSSTTNGTEGFTEIIFDADVVTSGSTVTIQNVAAAVAFTQAQITTIRIGTVVPVASGLANLTGLTSWSTTANSVVFVFNSNANALAADTAFSQIQARLTVTSTVDTIPVAAYNANGEGMLGAFLDGRLAEGDRVRFTQRVANLETHLRISTDVVNIDEHLIVEGPTSLNGTVNFGGRVTVPQPTDRADAARYEDTWLAAIESSGFPQTTSIRRLTVGGQSNIEVVQIIAVEGAGGIQTWYAYLGVAPNSAGTGFGIAFESVLYSTHATNPFAEGTSTTNAPINILGTSDNDFIRDITVRGDASVGGDLTVTGDTTTTGNTTMTSIIDTTNEFTDFPAANVGQLISGTTYQIALVVDTTSSIPGEADFIVNAETQDAIAALTPWDMGDSITLYFPDTQASASMSVVNTDGTFGLQGFIGTRRTVDVRLDAAGVAAFIAAADPAATNVISSTVSVYYVDDFRVFNTPSLPMTGGLTVGGDAAIAGDATIGSRDTTQNIFTGFVDGAGARVDSDTTNPVVPTTIPAGTVYRAYGFDDIDDTNAVGGDGIAIALPPGVTLPASSQFLSFGGTPDINGATSVSLVIGSVTVENVVVQAVAIGGSATLLGGAVAFLGLTQTQIDQLETLNEGTDLGLSTTADTRFYFRANQIELYASATIPMTGTLTVGGDTTIGGDVITGSGNTSLTITDAEELYTKVRALATAAVVATASVPSAFSGAALVVSRTLTQGSTSTLYYSVFNTGLTTETLYISTDLTNAIHTKTLQ